MVLEVDSIFDTAKRGADEFFVQEAEEALRPRLTLKTSNQSVTSSITVVNDSELFMPLSAQQTYEFELILGFSTDDDADPGIRITFTGPTGSTGSFYIDEYDLFDFLDPHVVWFDSKWTPTDFGVELEGFEDFSNFSTQGYEGTRIRGTIKTGNTIGNLQFKFAQRTTDPDATTIHAGSTLKVTRQ